MRYITAEVNANNAYLIPIGDLHIGDRAFGKVGRAKLKGYLGWVRNTPNARIFLMGDVFNVAGRTSKTSPFESSASEYDEAQELFQPVRAQILGVIDGNHEARMIDMFGVSPLKAFCRELKVPYCGWSAVLSLKVGRKQTSTYYGYMHHTTGGGGSLGGALNRSTRLQNIVQGMDFYCGGHNHQLVTGVQTVYGFSPKHRRLLQRKVTFVDCGSYLDYNESYAEKGMMTPGKLGSPKLSFRSATHDVHVSL